MTMCQSHEHRKRAAEESYRTELYTVKITLHSIGANKEGKKKTVRAID